MHRPVLAVPAYVLIAAVAVAPGRPLRGAEKARFAMSAAEFAGLSDDARKVLLHEAFSHRLGHGRNIHFESLQVLRNHHFADGEPKEVVWAGLKNGYRYWRLGDSYALETRQYGDPKNEEPQSVNRSNFDAETGLVRGTVNSPELKKGLGAISPRKDPQAVTVRYVYWLDGEKQGYAEHLFRNLVDSRDSYEVRVDQERGRVELEVPWRPKGFPKADGTWTYQLDPSKGFLPVEGRGHWQVTDPSSPERPAEHWRTEQFWVQDSKLVGDCWMPTALREVVRASTAEKDVATVYETKVSKVEQGGVTPEDLVVEFGDRRWVTDRVKGMSYYTDPQGQPRPDTVVSVTETGPPVPGGGSGSFTTEALLLFNLAVFALYVVFRMRRRILQR